MIVFHKCSVHEIVKFITAVEITTAFTRALLLAITLLVFIVPIALLIIIRFLTASSIPFGLRGVQTHVAASYFYAIPIIERVAISLVAVGLFIATVTLSVHVDDPFVAL